MKSGILYWVISPNATGNVTANSSRAELFVPSATRSAASALNTTGSTWISEVIAWRVGDANASALISAGRRTADVAPIEIAIRVPATQTVVTLFPVASGHRCHWWHGRNQQNNRWNLHPVSIISNKKLNFKSNSNDNLDNLLFTWMNYCISLWFNCF